MYQDLVWTWFDLTTRPQIAAAYSGAVAGDTIYVHPGTYKEKLTISKSSITIKGSTYPSLNPSDNTAVITYSTYASAAGSDDASGIYLSMTSIVVGANLHSHTPRLWR